MGDFKFSTSMYQRLFKHNIMPLIILDKTGTIVACNKKFTELTGINDATNKTFASIFKPETEEEKQKLSLIEFGFFNESSVHDLVMEGKKSKYYVRLWIDTEFDEELSLAAVENFTERRKLEIQLKEQNIQLKKLQVQLQNFNKKLEAKVEERTKELKQANHEILLLLEHKNRFINELAHDLRTPITPIVYLIESLTEDIKNNEVKKDLEIINNNAHYLKNLVEDILKLARLDNNKVEFNFAQTDINTIVDNVIKNNAIVLKKLGMGADNKISKKIKKVMIDPLKITEVLENLVMNATKFMDKGGKITFEAKDIKTHLEISVRDTGTGIEKENIEKIFQEFFKADSARHSHKSHGLGLSICRRIISKHGGKIWAESKGKGKGTTIKFTLPYEVKKNENTEQGGLPKEQDPTLHPRA